MTTQFELLEAEALKLSTADRARVVEHLIDSLDKDSEIEAAWSAEVETRIAEYESGMVAGIPFEEALAQARAGLK